MVKESANLACEGLSNSAKRFYCYKQFTFILHVHLGSDNRVKLPSCVENGVRDEFPEVDGMYTGFKQYTSDK